jgi:hypothetical protein
MAFLWALPWLRSRRPRHPSHLVGVAGGGEGVAGTACNHQWRPDEEQMRSKSTGKRCRSIPLLDPGGAMPPSRPHAFTGAARGRGHGWIWPAFRPPQGLVQIWADRGEHGAILAWSGRDDSPLASLLRRAREDEPRHREENAPHRRAAMGTTPQSDLRRPPSSLAYGSNNQTTHMSPREGTRVPATCDPPVSSGPRAQAADHTIANMPSTVK